MVRMLRMRPVQSRDFDGAAVSTDTGIAVLLAIVIDSGVVSALLLQEERGGRIRHCASASR